MKSSRGILGYRIGVAILALGYVAHQIGWGYWGSAGGPLRYLTNWALCGSALSAVMMVGISAGWIKRRPLTLAAVVAVMNAMVVIQYWRLYLESPAQINANGQIVWWREYYLHLLGPLLQWFDAVFLATAFQQHRRSIIALCSVVISYAAWAELFVGPLNSRPVGTVTSGLPYPFLNNMELDERMVFYGTNLVVALVLYAVFVTVSASVRRSRTRAAP